MQELAGAFGDLGTLIPFVLAYVSVLGMDPGAMVLMFGIWLIAVGAVMKTPFPVQPMKAIGAAAITQTAAGVALTPAMVTAAGLVTGVFWLLVAFSGMAGRLAALIPKPALLGVVIGLGFSFMLQGVRLMAGDWLLATVLLVLTLALLARARVPAMLLLLLAGVGVTLFRQPELLADLALIRPGFHLPGFLAEGAAWSALDWNALWMGAVFLALPQLPLTFGNALVAITDENNRLFPDRPVTHRKVALSTGLMNLFSSAGGGVPMCHGAGGMAGHVRFGARTGGSSIMLGGLLLVLGLFFSDSLALLLGMFPEAVLGIVLFLAGAELATSGRGVQGEKVDRFVVYATAAFAVINVGVAVVFGIAAFHAAKRGWLK